MSAGALSVRAAGAEAGERLAIVSKAEAVSWSALAERASEAESWLRQRGVQPCQREAVALDAVAHVDVVAMLLALVEIGVPCALVDPRLSPTARSDRARLARASVTCDEHWRSSLGGPPSPLGGDRWGRSVQMPSDEDVLAVVFTSGSTAAPKGVLLSRRAFVASAHASARRIGCSYQDRWLLCLPLAHVGGLSVVVRCLVARATIVLHDQGTGDAASLASTAERFGVTMMSVVPTQLRRMLNVRREGAWGSLRVVLVGGAACPPGVLVEARSRGIPAAATYGLTEGCSQVATQHPTGTPTDGAPPLDDVGVRVRDGVLEISGATLFSGYLPPYDLPFPIHDGWFSTQDLATLTDGVLRIHGRRSDIIVSGGENVNPSEVEAFLTGLDGIAAACVFGREDAEWGEAVCASLVAESAPDDATLAQAVRDGLAAHQRPRYVVWVTALPVNRTGKIDRARAKKDGMGALRPLRSQ